MQFATLALFAASAVAASTFVKSETETETITSCDETVTNCPLRNTTQPPVTTYPDAAATNGYYAAGAVALAAGALLM